MLPQLAEEVKDVCAVLGWRYREDNNDVAKGFLFSPPECEPFLFTFRPDGQLVNKLYLQYNIEPSNTVSVKTQFAGMDVHVAAIKLLKHLAKRYFAVFEVSDEGGYWETMDEAVLAKKFGLYDRLMNTVQKVLTEFPAQNDKTKEGFVQRLKAFLQERLTEKKIKRVYKLNLQHHFTAVVITRRSSCV